MRSSYVLFIVLLFSSCHDKQVKGQNREESEVKTVQSSFSPSTIGNIALPHGFVRDSATLFGKYLRELPLKPDDGLVSYYNGEIKPKGNVYDYVVDLEIGKKDLHQCADAIIRLRAEYLYSQKRYHDIHFNFTNGMKVEYSEWMKGKRIKVEGNNTTWQTVRQPSNTYSDFWNYLEQIFTYAGTASLEKELEAIHHNEATIGDILIQGGYPGHAMIIVDKAIHSETKESIYLLAQSYMPAQQIQVVKNPNSSNLSPWYTLNTESIITPEWTFSIKNLKRFKN